MLKQDSEQLPHSKPLLQLFHAVLSSLPRQRNNHSHLGSLSHSNPHEGRLGQGPTRGPNDSYPEYDKIVENESDLAEFETPSLPHMVEVNLQDPFLTCG